MATTAADAPARDIRTIGLISTAHGSSHFYQLVLPTLGPLLIATFDMSYAEFGIVISLFYGASGLAQTPAGFLVDRLGARTVLLGGIALYGAAFASIGLVPQFWMMLPLVILAGLGNSVFHPADYSILTATVSPQRLARAYSVHTIAGNLGWAAAPVTVLTLAGFLGWRGALIAVGLGGILLAAVLALLTTHLIETAAVRVARRGGRAPWDVLLSRPILTCFSYFALVATTLIAMQTFLPTALNAVHGTPLNLAALALTAYLLGSSAGILLGGVLADRIGQHSRIVTIGLIGAASLILLVGFLALPPVMLVGVIALAGFSSGVTTPSRDVLARSVTPPGATGKVFGFVYSGLDLGSALSPTVFGFLLDRHAAPLVFVVAAVALLCAIVAAAALDRRPRVTAVTAAAE